MALLGVCVDYRSTRDFFSFISVAEPEFEGLDNVNLVIAFDDLFGGIQKELARTKTVESSRCHLNRHSCRLDVQFHE